MFDPSCNVNKAYHLVLDLLEALEIAHQQQIPHGDVRPHNIILRCKDGRASVIDWGTTLLRLSDITSAFVGTPAYAATRILRAISKGKSWALSAADDVE